MNLICLLLSVLFCDLGSALEPKLCKNCKHFIPHPRNIKFSKCELFQKLQEDDFVLIDNIVFDIPVQHYYCSVTRNYNHMCGKKGKKYEEN